MPFPAALLIVLGLVNGASQRDAVAATQNENRDARNSPRSVAVQDHRRSGTSARFGRQTVPPRAKGAIRLATYNMLNLFDHVDDLALQGEFDDARMSTSADRCASMARAIREIDPDIIALQEIESLEALKWFRDSWLKDAGYEHLVSHDVGYYRGVECSIMSRFKIEDSKVWRGESLENVERKGPGWAPVPPGVNLTFQRSPLMVNVTVGSAYELTIFSIHHKAGAEFDHHREAEAIRVMELVEQVRRADPSRNIVLMGDFNAAPSDKSLRVYLEGGLIDTLAHRAWQGDGPEAMLYKTHESNRVLDYVLLNSAAHRELVLGSPFVYGTLTPPPSYDFRTDQPPPGYASDHYPVVIDLVPKDQE